MRVGIGHAQSLMLWRKFMDAGGKFFQRENRALWKVGKWTNSDSARTSINGTLHMTRPMPVT